MVELNALKFLLREAERCNIFEGRTLGVENDLHHKRDTNISIFLNFFNDFLSSFHRRIENEAQIFTQMIAESQLTFPPVQNASTKTSETFLLV